MAEAAVLSPLLSMRHIIKRFGGNVAVNNVSLDIYPGGLWHCWEKTVPVNRR